jgi:hypothetical protein
MDTWWRTISGIMNLFVRALNAKVAGAQVH